MRESLTCPKCTGPRDARALYCPFCGAIFNRLSGSPVPAAVPAPAYGLPAPGAAPALAATPVAQSLNPYQPPASSVAPYRTESKPVELPERIGKKIRHAWVAAVFSGSVTLIFALVAMNVGSDLGVGFSEWMLVDVVLIFGLAYGISRKSRVCATTMFLYFLGSKIYIWSASGSASGLPLAFVFLYFFYQGMAATFEYHKLQEAGAR